MTKQELIGKIAEGADITFQSTPLREGRLELLAEVSIMHKKGELKCHR
jgi:hypothetical protein